MTVIGEAYITIKGVDDIGPSLKGAADQVGGVGAAAEKSTGRARAAFRTLGNSLGNMFGPAFAPIQEVMDKFEGISFGGGKMRENVGKSFLGVGAAATAAGTLITTVSDKDKIAMRQLQNAVQNAGGDWKEYKERTEDTIKSQEKYGHNAVDTQKALTGLVTKTKDVNGSYKNMQVVADLAAQKNISLSAAGGIVGKIMTGNTRTLKMFGISQDDVNKAMDTGAVKQKNTAMQAALTAAARDKDRLAALKTRDAQIQETIATTKDKGEKEKLRDQLAKDRAERGRLSDSMKNNTTKAKDLKDEIKKLTTGTGAGDAATKLLADKLKGQAAAAADTFTGKMKAARARVEDFVGSVGQKIGPALQIAGPAMLGIGTIIESGIIGKMGKAIGKIKEFDVAGKLSGAATKVWTGIQAAFNLVMEANPIFLVVGAIVALVAIIVVAYIKFKPFRDLVNAIGRDMKEIFVKSIDFVVRAFRSFVQVFESVWKFLVNIIKRYWPIILAVLLPFIGIPVLIITQWRKIVAAFKEIWSTVFSTIKNFIGRIVDGIRGLWERGSALITNFVSSVIRIITGLPARAAAALAQLGSKVAAKFTSMASTAGGAVTKFVSSVVSSVGSIITKSVAALATFGSQIKTKLISATAGAATWLVDAGKNMVRGFISGITGMFGDVAKAAGNMIAHLGGKVLKVLHLGSPSKLAMYWGQMVGEGLAQGMEASHPRVANAASNMLAIPAGASAIGVAGSAAGGVGGRTFNLFPNAIINMGDESPDQLVQRLQTALMASRL